MISGLLRLVMAFSLMALAQSAGAQVPGTDLPSAPELPSTQSTPLARAKIHTELGAAYFQQGNAPVALEELEVAIKADSSYFPAYSVRGLVYAFLKEFSKAEQDFRQALSIAPNDPGVNNNFGWYLCEIGKYRESMTFFMSAIRNPLYDTPERAYTNAGTCALKAGDIEAAERYLHQSLALSRDGGGMARFQLANLYYRRGIYQEAQLYLRDALKMMEPPSAAALWLGIRLEKKLGNRVAEGGYAAQLRSRYSASQEYQDFLNGKFND